MLRHRKTVDSRLKSIGLEDAQRAAFWKRAEHLQKVGRGEDVLIFSEITLMDVARMSEGQKLVEGKSVKGDLPGHPFRGNQWSGSGPHGEPIKREAVKKGESVAARREGKGKDAKVILENGQEAPPHIKASMIPPAWKNVRVYTDPDSEVLVEATQTTARGVTSNKRVYKDSYEQEQQAAKHYRIEQMMDEDRVIKSQIREGLRDPKTREEAAVAMLMDIQATRPGSEADARGLNKFYGKEMKPEMVIVTPPKPNKKGEVKGDPKVEIEVHGEKIHIRDKRTAAELIKRKETGEGLEDTTFWLKSHGATTLEKRNVVETSEGLRLQFVGKEGVWHDHLIKDPALAEVIRQQVDKSEGGKIFKTNETKVSAYVETLDTGRFSPKDFRTKRATELALEEVRSKYANKTPKDAKERQAWIMDVSTKAASVLGNQPKQCFETYINPHLWDLMPKAAA
jgi:DNA topoisomerase IB